MLATYGPREKVEQITAPLISHLSLLPSLDSPSQNLFTSSTNSVALQHFEPPNAHDTAIVHLALNVPGDPLLGWPIKRKIIERFLTATTLQEATWGYTLIYQAVWEGDAPTDADLSTLLPYLQCLAATENDQLKYSLATVQIAGGELYLLDLPLTTEGYAAATIYLALCPPAANDNFVGELIFGPGAALALPDLLAHKGYYLVRQYRAGDRFERFKQMQREIIEAANNVLAALATFHPQPLAAHDPAALSYLTHDFPHYLPLVIALKRLRLSLAQQIANLTPMAQALGEVSLLHQQNLQLALEELDLQFQRNEDVVELAWKAIDFARLEQGEKAEAREETLQRWLAVIGAVLSFCQVFTWNTACWFLLRLQLMPNCQSQWALRPFLLQFFSAALLGVLVLYCLNRWRKAA